MPGSGADTPITADSTPQGVNRSGPGAIALGRGPAAGSSSGHGDSVARHLFRVLVLTTAAVLTSAAAILGLLALGAAATGTPPERAMDAAVRAVADAAMPHFPHVLAALLVPFPLAGVVFAAVLCAAAWRPRRTSHRSTDGNRHGS